MDYGEFSKKELSEALGIVHDATSCSTKAGLKSILSGLKELVEAERAICALGDSEGRILKAVNLSYPEEWLTMYADGGFAGKDPVLLYNQDSPRPFFWSDSLRVYSDKEHRGLMNDAAEFGLRYGVSSGVKSPEKGVASIFSFSGERNSFRERHLKLLDMVTPHVHQALLRLIGGPLNPSHGLSARELEVLGLMKRGVSYREVSISLNISLRTVKYHVRNIKDKLYAVNKAHAIAIAAGIGL
ncbi:MAG: LuxR family transcriptional regulator [Deltaproteobacteria bacterium]|nr:LuxR family transcriptional regulator [Deltaproteobacteria bacterium]